MPGFTLNAKNAGAVATLCRKLEGISLLIELAAARAHLYSPSEMVEQMNRPLEFLVSRLKDKSERHLSLRSAMDWSYRILSDPAKAAFRQMSLARGGWKLRWAEEVLKLEEANVSASIEELCESSLIRSVTQGDSIRFQLHEVFRAVGLELLGKKELEAVQDRRLLRLVQLANELDSAEAMTDPGVRATEVKAWLDELGEEVENIRDCLEWAWANGRDEIAAELSCLLYPFWERRNSFHEAIRWLKMGASKQNLPRELRALVLLNAGMASRWICEYEEAETFYLEAAEIFREQGDLEMHASAWWRIGTLKAIEGNLTQAEKYFSESLAESGQAGIEPDPRPLLNMSMIAYQLADYPAARRYRGEALHAAIATNDPFMTAGVLLEQADDLASHGHFRSADEAVLDAMKILNDLGDPIWNGAAALIRSQVYYFKGDLKQAAHLLDRAAILVDDADDLGLRISLAIGTAKLDIAKGRHTAAEAKLTDAYADLPKYKDPPYTAEVCSLLAAITHRRDPQEAAQFVLFGLAEIGQSRCTREFFQLLLVSADIVEAADKTRVAEQLRGVAAGLYSKTSIVPDPVLAAPRLKLKAAKTRMEMGEAWQLAVANLRPMVEQQAPQ